MRVDGYLRPDIDDDLISFIFESMQFNLAMFFPVLFYVCGGGGSPEWGTVI